MGIFGGGGSQTTTVQNYSPAEQRYRTDVMQAGQQAFRNSQADLATAPFTGPAPVAFDPRTIAGQNAALQVGQQFAGLNPDVMAAMKAGLNAPDIANNPYLQALIATQNRQIGDAFTGAGGPLAQVRQSAQGAGAAGGSRQGIAEGLAMQGYGRALADTTARTNWDAYQQGVNTQANTLQTLPQVQNALLQPAQILQAVGAQSEAKAAEFAQYGSDAANWDLNREWLPLQNYANIIYGGGSSQTQTTAPSPRGNPLMAGLGGAAMGMSLGGPWGAAAGGVLGLLSA